MESDISSCATCSCCVNFKNYQRERYVMNDPRVIQIAVDTISRLLSQADAATMSGAQRTILYLLATRECLRALEQEVQEIALEASFVDCQDSDAVMQLG